jgi:hypothetical protein
MNSNRKGIVIHLHYSVNVSHTGFCDRTHNIWQMSWLVLTLNDKRQQNLLSDYCFENITIILFRLGTSAYHRQIIEQNTNNSYSQCTNASCF